MSSDAWSTVFRWWSLGPGTPLLRAVSLADPGLFFIRWSKPIFACTASARSWWTRLENWISQCCIIIGNLWSAFFGDAKHFTTYWKICNAQVLTYKSVVYLHFLKNRWSQWKCMRDQHFVLGGKKVQTTTASCRNRINDNLAKWSWCVTVRY